MEQMGHGRTADFTNRPFHYHDMAEVTIEMTRLLGIESAAVVGYSDGGIIALEMAIHHSDRVAKLAVTGANSRTDGDTAKNLEWVRSFDPDTEPTAAYARLSPDGVDHWPTVLRRLQQMWAVEPSLTDKQLQSIATPTLVIVGDSDIVTLEHSIEMLRAIPDAQLCVVPRSGHGIMPKEAVMTFLEESDTGQN
jgi:pimeloyl-ACP methyl ester carboxylesterase